MWEWCIQNFSSPYEDGFSKSISFRAGNRPFHMKLDPMQKLNWISWWPSSKLFTSSSSTNVVYCFLFALGITIPHLPYVGITFNLYIWILKIVFVHHAQSLWWVLMVGLANTLVMCFDISWIIYIVLTMVDFNAWLTFKVI